MENLNVTPLGFVWVGRSYQHTEEICIYIFCLRYMAIVSGKVVNHEWCFTPNAVDTEFVTPILACPNEPVCMQKYAKEWLECWNGLCLECDLHIGKCLVFTHYKHTPGEQKGTEDGFECCICYQDVEMSVKHPACDRHEFCIPCMRRMMCPTSVEYTSRIIWFETAEAVEPTCVHGTPVCQVCDVMYDEAVGREEDEWQAARHDTCPLCRVMHIPPWIHQELR